MKRRVSRVSLNHSKNLVELLKKKLVGSFKKIKNNEKRYDR